LEYQTPKGAPPGPSHAADTLAAASDSG